MTDPIQPGQYAKCLRHQAADPEIVRVHEYIGEPTYILVDDADKQFPCPASLVDSLSATEEINFWRLRAHAAEEKARLLAQTKIYKSDSSVAITIIPPDPTTIIPQPQGTVELLPMGVKNENGFLIAHCDECADHEELEAITTVAVPAELAAMGWRQNDQGLTCAFCLEKEASRGVSETEAPQD